MGVALLAVGGYGRRELAPFSDLDVILVHDPEVSPEACAEQLWYPLWDSGWRLDHSVRSLPEVLEAAGDLKVALGLLDARHLAGDAGLALRLRTTMQADWRRQARTRLPELRENVRRRHLLLGELAHAAVPDLKESEGGLRDVGVLRALQASWLVDASVRELAPAHRFLLDVRDVLHEASGRPTDRIAPEHWDVLAERLGLAGADEVQRRVRTAGRRIAHLSHLTWRRVDALLEAPRHGSGGRTPALREVAPGIAVSRGEVVLHPSARPAEQPDLLLRAAAEAAARGLPLAPASAARLVRECPDLPDPWPAATRDALVRLLAAGPGLRAVWETLEETGAVDRFLPEWERIRLLPHASPIHRFTVDRHVVETCVEAGALIRAVARPDLLLVAALLHDIGKGEAQEHSVAGEPLARAVAARMGFGPADVERVGGLVRHHLLLSGLAASRDPDAEATAAEVVAAVPDEVSLGLLRALTEADARATAPAAWTDWRRRLVDRLTDRALGLVRSAASAAAHPDLARPDPGLPDPGLPSTPDGWGVRVVPDPTGALVTVVSGERTGLLADVAGVLCAMRVPVREARAWASEHDSVDWGHSAWWVAAPDLDAALLHERLRLSAAGDAGPTRPRCACDRPAPPAPGPPPMVQVGPEESSAAVLEARMADTPGTVHRVLATLASLDLTVVSAHVSTLGPQAVDVFYVQEAGGVRPGEERAAEAAHAVRRALGG